MQPATQSSQILPWCHLSLPPSLLSHCTFLNMPRHLGDPPAPLICWAGDVWALHFHILKSACALIQDFCDFLWNHNGFLFRSGQKCHLCNNGFPIREHVLPFHLLGSFKFFCRLYSFGGRDPHTSVIILLSGYAMFSMLYLFLDLGCLLLAVLIQQIWNGPHCSAGLGYIGTVRTLDQMPVTN